VCPDIPLSLETLNPPFPSQDGQQAIKKLCGALDETSEALTRLTASSLAPRGSVRVRALLPDDTKCLLLTPTLLKSTLASSTLEDDTTTLMSLRLDITTCRENLEKSRLHLTKIYKVDHSRTVDLLRVPSTIFTLRRKLGTWFKQRRPRLPRNTHETKAGGDHPMFETPPTVGDFLVLPSLYNPWVTSELLQLPTELKLYVLDILDAPGPDQLPSRSNPLCALRL
jgi:hypothetical protein